MERVPSQVENRPLKHLELTGDDPDEVEVAICDVSRHLDSIPGFKHRRVW